MSQILALLLVLLSLSISASEAVGSRSTLGVIINNNRVNVPDAAVNLNVTNFEAELRDTPAAYAIVEFYAHWCPACRNYKPHYEKVARLFNGPDAVHPGVILMTRVDCALKINTNLCDKFSVERYPMLFWGPSLKFVSGGWKPRQEKSEIHIIDDRRTAERLLNWINKEMGSSYGLDDEHRSSNASEQVLHTAA